MHERRRHPRQPTERQLELFERHTGRHLGRLADLSAEGFMLVSEAPLVADQVIECRLQSNEAQGDLGSIEFVADCLWSRPGADGLHCWAGFHIIDLADDQSAALQRLLASL